VASIGLVWHLQTTITTIEIQTNLIRSKDLVLPCLVGCGTFAALSIADVSTLHTRWRSKGNNIFRKLLHDRLEPCVIQHGPITLVKRFGLVQQRLLLLAANVLATGQGDNNLFHTQVLDQNVVQDRDQRVTVHARIEILIDRFSGHSDSGATRMRAPFASAVKVRLAACGSTAIRHVDPGVTENRVVSKQRLDLAARRNIVGKAGRGGGEVVLGQFAVFHLFSDAPRDRSHIDRHQLVPACRKISLERLNVIRILHG
jgi:hypothetical protein